MEAQETVRGGVHTSYRGASSDMAVRIRGASKTFAGRKVLNDVALDLAAGEVHALVGANGSGKSTLIKILSGFHEPDPGSDITVAGQPLASARKLLSFVHQDLGLIGDLTVTENFVIEHGTGIGALKRVRRREEQRRITNEVRSLGLDVPTNVPVDKLDPVERSIAAIARCVRHADQAVAVVMDEPTAALPRRQVQRLFAAVRSVAERGTAVLLVTHKLEEVFALATRVTVLRDGLVVASQETSTLTRPDLVTHIVGHAIGKAEAASSGTAMSNVNAPVLRMEGVRGVEVVDASLEVFPGEIIGMAGVEGSGYKELLHMVVGSRQNLAGTITIDGTVLRNPTPRSALEHGCVFIPADRRGHGLHMEFSLRENICLPAAVVSSPLRRINVRQERRHTLDWLALTGVTPPDPERPIKELSGGNQQKVLLAKWMSMEPRVLLLEDPTQAVDVGARDEIHRLLIEAARRGTAIIIASSDTQELSLLCDRVVVMQHGRLGPTLTKGELSDAAIARATLEEGDLGAQPREEGQPA